MLWIEVECPVCILDYDEEPCPPNATWRCPGCGTEHRIGDVGQMRMADVDGTARSDLGWNGAENGT